MTREMKNSGVEWIGDIPSEWKLEKNKHCFELTKNIVGGNFSSFELLSLTKKGIVIKDVNNSFGKVPESYETYQSVKKGQLVLCLFDLDCSAVFSGLSNHNGMISPAYKVYDCKNNIDKKYATYWFDYCFDGRKYKIYSKSLRYVVNADDFGDIEIILPPLYEQKKIADFLDSKVTEIDKIISETKTSIENYKEYKQAVITEAVTKGLDKNVVRKNCNIQWINEIPKHWSEKKILHITSMPVIDGPHVSPTLYNDGIPYISADAIENGKINFDRKRGYISKEYSEECNKRYKPKENDILVVKLGASTGKMAIVGKETNFNIWVPLAVVRCKDNIFPKFVFYCMTSQYFKNEIKNGWTFGTQETLGVKTLEQLKICIPDNLQEQQEIVDFLDNKCAEIDSLIAEKEKLITNLEEYKKSLIYEYVTGKKEVQ